MKTSAPLANLITLGARDFVSLRDFYRNLGWPQIIDDGQFAAFDLRGIVHALFPINQLAHDGNAEPEPGVSGSPHSLRSSTLHPLGSLFGEQRVHA